MDKRLTTAYWDGPTRTPRGSWRWHFWTDRVDGEIYQATFTLPPLPVHCRCLPHEAHEQAQKAFARFRDGVRKDILARRAA